MRLVLQGGGLGKMMQMGKMSRCDTATGKEFLTCLLHPTPCTLLRAC